MRIFAPILVLSAVVSAMMFLPAAHAQPPETVLIQGQLLDDQGAPIVGLRQFRVRFFDAETEGAQLGGDVVDFTQVNAQGLFAIALIPPAAALEAPAAWYELALDSASPALGVGPEDVFPQRVRVHSVPFARVAGEALSVEVGSVGDGSVTLPEFNSLAGITGSVQSQLETKAEAAAVDDALALKADQETVEDALDDKADLAEVLPRAGAAFVVVETTDDPAQNAANLQAAYAEASALDPHGEALSAANRAVVIVPPGKYDLGSGQLLMDTEFVDLVGSTTSRDNHHISGTSNGLDSGVLRQTADNVRIENLFVVCTRADGSLANDASDPAAYFPESGLENTVVRNCRFLADDSNAWSMRIAIEYAGIYEDSTGGSRAFGGDGTASGTFTNCTGGQLAFGGSGTASGTFTDCTGGGNAFAGGGTASGTFTNCIGVGRAFGGFGGIASGVFTNCTAGIGSFGGGGGTASGVFTNCTGSAEAFGGTSFSGQGTASGTFTNCIGGARAFAGGQPGFVGTASGTFTNCTGGNRAFAGGGGGSAEDGEFYYCVGGEDAFTNIGSPVHRYGVRDGQAFP